MSPENGTGIMMMTYKGTPYFGIRSLEQAGVIPEAPSAT